MIELQNLELRENINLRAFGERTLYMQTGENRLVSLVWVPAVGVVLAQYAGQEAQQVIPMSNIKRMLPTADAMDRLLDKGTKRRG